MRPQRAVIRGVHSTASMKKSYLYTISVLVEFDEAELVPDELDFTPVDRTGHRIVDTIDAAFPDAWQTMGIRELDPATMNCGRCAECGCWTTDCERPDRLTGVNAGAVHDGRLLCDDHLPEDHPWAF